MYAFRRLGKVFPPGDYVRAELEARGWSQGDLARIVGRPLQVINLIINGRKAVTADTAAALGAAFGTGPQVWLNLESKFQLSQVTIDEAAIVARRQAMTRRPRRRALAKA